MEISASATTMALQHELAEAQAKIIRMRQQLYTHQEQIEDLEDELDFIWNRSGNE